MRSPWTIRDPGLARIDQSCSAKPKAVRAATMTMLETLKRSGLTVYHAAAPSRWPPTTTIQEYAQDGRRDGHNGRRSARPSIADLLSATIGGALISGIGFAHITTVDVEYPFNPLSTGTKSANFSGDRCRAIQKSGEPGPIFCVWTACNDEAHQRGLRKAISRTRRNERGPHCRRQHSDKQARGHRAAIHSRHRQATKANEIVDKVSIPAQRRVNELSDAEVIQIREVIDRDYMVEGDLAPRGGDEQEAFDGSRMLSGLAPPAWSAGPRATDAYERTGPARGRPSPIAGKKKVAL